MKNRLLILALVPLFTACPEPPAPTVPAPIVPPTVPTPTEVPTAPTKADDPSLTGRAVARILIAKGYVHVIEKNGNKVHAKEGTSLLRTDTITTSKGSFAVIQLHNNYLVKIDESLELDVADIVLLDAEKTDADPKTQLSQMLNPEERVAAGDAVHRAERVAGWHARLVAAETVPVAMKSKKSRAGLREATRAPLEEEVRRSRRTGAQEKKEEDEADHVHEDEAEEPPAPPRSSTVAGLRTRADLKQCIAAARPGQRTAKVTLHFKDGKLIKVAVAGGAAPACATKLIGTLLFPKGQKDGPAVVVIPLR